MGNTMKQATKENKENTVEILFFHNMPMYKISSLNYYIFFWSFPYFKLEDKDYRINTNNEECKKVVHDFLAANSINDLDFYKDENKRIKLELNKNDEFYQKLIKSCELYKGI